MVVNYDPNDWVPCHPDCESCKDQKIKQPHYTQIRIRDGKHRWQIDIDEIKKAVVRLDKLKKRKVKKKKPVKKKATKKKKKQRKKKK